MMASERVGDWMSTALPGDSNRWRPIRLVMNKTTHFGRAGEFFIVSELLLRAWNVAVPVVDMGDDVYVAAPAVLPIIP